MAPTDGMVASVVTSPPRPRGSSRRFVAVLVAVLVVTAACGSEQTETDYNELNRNAFLSACTDALSDDLLVRDICECAYEEIEANIPLGDLASLEESLRVDSLRGLPDNVAGYLADCFVAEADL